MTNNITVWLNQTQGELGSSIATIDDSGNIVTAGAVTTNELQLKSTFNLNLLGNSSQAQDINLTLPAGLPNIGQYLTATAVEGDSIALDWTNGDGSGTVTSVDLSTSSTGVTIGGSPITDSGTLTVDINNELQGLAGLNLDGFVTRTAEGTYTATSIVSGDSGNLVITNGNGVAGNPTIDLASSINVSDLHVNNIDILSNMLYAQSYFVNQGVNDIQTVLTTIGSSQGNTIYIGSGSYGGSTVSVTGKSNLSIVGANIGKAITNTELSGGRGLTVDSTSFRIRINSLLIKGLLTLGAIGNNYFTNLALASGITIPASTSGSFFFNDCDISGTITVPSSFAGLLVFTNCNFNGVATTFSLNNPVAAQVAIIGCTNLTSFSIINATLGSQNSLATTYAVQTLTNTLIASSNVAAQTITPATMTIAQRNALTVTNGTLAFTSDNDGSLSLYNNGTWRTIAFV